MTFAVLMVWTETKDHSSDCYFCSTDITRISYRSKNMVIYPNLPPSMRLVPHNDKLPVSKPPNNVTTDEDNSDADEFQPSYSSKLP
jgi:galactose-1-phosphate uridylyltransferase